MSRFLIRALPGLVLVLAAALSRAGTLEVSAPNDGDFVGRTNTVSFVVRGATLQVTVRVEATGSGGTITSEGQFTPDNDGVVNKTLPLNFAPSNPEGPYTIVVTATEQNNNYNTVTFTVTLDVTSPKFLHYNPIPGAFIRGIVPITVEVNEPNVKEMRVQVNNEDIPNNTTDQNFIVVNWDTSGIELDGPQTIKIKVKDKAGNESTQEMEVTLDRVSPAISVLYPRTDTQVRKGAVVPVIIDIVDGQDDAVGPSGVDVLLTRMDGSFIRRVPRSTFKSSGGKLTWSGRIRWAKDLPSTFKMKVLAVDKAGNVAQMQEVTLSIR